MPLVTSIGLNVIVGVIEVQSSLPSSHIFFVDNHRADLVNLPTLCNPRVWNTVKSFFIVYPGCQ